MVKVTQIHNVHNPSFTLTGKCQLRGRGRAPAQQSLPLQTKKALPFHPLHPSETKQGNGILRSFMTPLNCHYFLTPPPEFCPLTLPLLSPPRYRPITPQRTPRPSPSSSLIPSPSRGLVGSRNFCSTPDMRENGKPGSYITNQISQFESHDH